jgi:hypothetical protein
MENQPLSPKRIENSDLENNNKFFQSELISDQKQMNIHCSKEFEIPDWDLLLDSLKDESSENDDNFNWNVRHSSPNFDRWSPEEDDFLLQLVKEFGTKWKYISTKLYNRSPNCPKNRWHRYLKQSFEEELKNSTPKKQKPRVARLVLPNNSKRENLTPLGEEDGNLCQTADDWFEKISKKTI